MKNSFFLSTTDEDNTPTSNIFIYSVFWRTFIPIFSILLIEIILFHLSYVYIDKAVIGHDEYFFIFIILVLNFIFTLLLSSFVTRFINKPINEIVCILEKFKKGNLLQKLNENCNVYEVKTVNTEINKMAEDIYQFEQDRVMMLAGISHDLRTPLARILLEVELHVHDEVTKTHIANDIEQANAIIEKFIEYAVSASPRAAILNLNDSIFECINRYEQCEDTLIHYNSNEDLWIEADPVEFQRILNNLIDNARCYGKTPITGKTEIDIDISSNNSFIFMKFRDHGSGVPTEQLSKLTSPFVRGDTARSMVTGSGLGLAIVEKNIKNMGGACLLKNSTHGGLTVNLRLPRINPIWFS